MSSRSIPLQAQKKYERLLLQLGRFSKVAVAFSGGVDSSLLYYAAREALGEENVFVFRAISELVSQRERESADALLDHFALPADKLLEIHLAPLAWEEFVTNSETRCYVCKWQMYTRFLQEAKQRGCNALLDGTNSDDLKAVRLGFQAIQELGVQTPLADVALCKEEIRMLARQFAIPSHDKPSNSCLATRIPQGTAVSPQTLELVEKSESYLLDHGFSSCRIRVEGENAVVQLPAADRHPFLSDDFCGTFMSYMQDIGFKRILLDVKPRG